MAQLKDLIVNGATRLIGDAYVNNIQITNLIAPTSAGGSTYGPGTQGQVLLSNNGSVYWGSAAPTVTESVVSGWGFTKIGTTDTTAAAGNHTHTTSLVTDNGNATITLAHNTTYKLTAGGTNVIFKTPTVPTAISSFTNDAGYITSADVPEGASAYAGTISAVGTSANTGTDNGFARGDHIHNITKTTINSVLGTGTGTTKFYREDGTWATPNYIANTDEKLKIAAVTSGTTYYPIVAANSTTAANRQYDATGFAYVGTNGTTSAIGAAKITLGNSTASGTANNKQGSIVLYGSTAYATTITPGAPSAARTITLPNESGTIVLSSNPTIVTDSGIATVSLTENTTYKLTTGGGSLIFKTPIDTNTDTKVTQAYSTANDSYPLLLSATNGVTSTSSRGDTTAILSNKFYANPSTGTITATTFSGALSGNASTATTATNLAAAPSLTVSGNNITVTAGGKTSSAFTVPYATNAGTATKLGTANKGSSIKPIYLSAGTPTECTIPSNGAWWSAIPQILQDGVMEIGKYIDFHTTSNGTTDYDVRITAETTGLTITGTTSGTFSGQLTTSKIIGSGTAIYGTDLPSSGTVGQIFFKYVT